MKSTQAASSISMRIVVFAVVITLTLFVSVTVPFLQKYITTDGFVLILILLEYNTMLVDVEHDNPFTILVIFVDSNAMFGVGKLILNPLVENKSSFPGLSDICVVVFAFERDISFDEESVGCVAVMSCGGVGFIGSAGATCFLLRESNELEARSIGFIDNEHTIGS
jgi:hypothetical protein